MQTFSHTHTHKSEARRNRIFCRDLIVKGLCRLPLFPLCWLRCEKSYLIRVTVFLAELEELLLSLKQVRGCLSDQQSQNDIELVLALLNKVI